MKEIRATVWSSPRSVQLSEYADGSAELTVVDSAGGEHLMEVRSPEQDGATERIDPTRIYFDGATPVVPDDEAPTGIQPGDRVVYVEDGSGDGADVLSVDCRGLLTVRWHDGQEVEGYLAPELFRRVYTADSPEPPADVTVLRETEEGGLGFLVRGPTGWGWWSEPVAVPECSFSWSISRCLHGVLVEYRDGD